MNPLDEPLLIFDGACGTQLQKMNLPTSVWEGRYEGCNEYLNLSAPDAIVALHRSYLDAGSQVLETNTFGANAVVLAEYGLESRVAEINRAAVENARRAIAGGLGKYVAGSVGPGTKLASLGQIDWERMSQSYATQFRALLEAGVDMLMIETCQDLLQVKIALVTCFDVQAELGTNLPVLVSITVETTGTMLVGSDVATVAATLEPFPLFSLGLNCATGPEKMKSHLRQLSRVWKGRLSCIPNAGIPRVEDGRTVYPLTPEDFAAQMKAFVVEDGVSIVGGCCGTTPEHIRRLVEALEGVRPAERDPVAKPALSSLYRAVEAAQDIPPLIVGERANANGSKRFREALLADDFQGALRIGIEQENDGAHLVDLCTAYAGRDEWADLTRMTHLFAESVKPPLVLDSTTPECIEACLRIYPGRCLINSINLEDGGKNLERICRAAKRFGAAVIALTINHYGMARTVEQKVETARQIYELAVRRYGLRPHDLFFDALTFTIGSGDETLRDAAMQTLEAIRRIKRELPGVFTLLGVSNISFGLPTASRKILNSVFLHEAIEAGLDAAIIDAARILPLAQIPLEERELCLDLIYDRSPAGAEQTPIMRYIEYFEQRKNVGDEDTPERSEGKSAEDALADKLVRGDKDGLEDLLAICLERKAAVDIINQVLVPAMRKVGELFGRGEMLLPFVLQSAEVMKRCVGHLEPFMEKADAQSGVRILLATVRGDVHDIGKNLVDIILSNNGYTVFNIGINVPAETIIEKAREHNVQLIGLSGLLVKSALVMKDSMPQFREAGLGTPILLGGAALTSRFVAESCVPNYDRPVVYCADAFAGLKAVQQFEAGTLKATEHRGEAGQGATLKPGPKDSELSRSNPVPKPPFLGARHVRHIDPERLFPYLNKQALFRGRWGYRRAKLSAEDYQALIENTVEPLFEQLKRRCLEEELLAPQAAYGYFPCHANGDRLVVQDGDTEHVFAFPRQGFPPHLCIADYYKTREEGGDITGFFVVTIGERICRITRSLYEHSDYHDYLMLHGLGVELTDALAEYWHEVMREELGIGDAKPADLTGYVTQKYQGSRYGFGYPACPDLEAHVPVFAMLHPEAIGVTLTESMEMVPEQTTSAIVAHHPQAKYFAT